MLFYLFFAAGCVHKHLISHTQTGLLTRLQITVSHVTITDTNVISQDNNDMARMLKFNRRTEPLYRIDSKRMPASIPMTDPINRPHSTFILNRGNMSVFS